MKLSGSLRNFGFLKGSERSGPSLKMRPGRELAYSVHLLELWVVALLRFSVSRCRRMLIVWQFYLEFTRMMNFSRTAEGVTTKIGYFGLGKCLWCIFVKLSPLCTVKFNHWLPCYFLTRFFMRFKKKITGSKPTMPSEYVSTGHPG